MWYCKNMNVCGTMASRLIAFVLLLIVMRENSFSFAQYDSIDKREGLIEEALKSLLGVKERLESGSVAKRKLPSPPRYMLDLYDQYKTGKVTAQGNTVRSILPMRDKFDGVDMLVFNLTGIHPDEQIIQSTLHVYKRGHLKMKNKRFMLNFRLNVFDLSTDSVTQSIDLSTDQKKGWFPYNVTDSVTRCRSTKNLDDYLLGIMAESYRPNGKYRPVFLRRVMRQNSQPFLIIFSEDRNNKSEIQNEENTSQDLEVLFKNKILNISEYKASLETIVPRRTKRSIYDVLPTKYELVTLKSTSNRNMRLTRSLPSNVLRNEMNEVFVYNSSNLSEEDKLLVKYSKKIDPNIIPVPHNMKTRKKHPWRKKKNRRKNRKLPFWWMKYDGKHFARNAQKVCQRKKLVVDFSKIGWTEWIIAPNSFDAYYCQGSCSFPLIKNGRPSNHAIIQSLVHTFGIDPEVPVPCCIPSATSSLTMLYVDENDRVILKNYPGMIVESCACR